jgi:hypothetical protein
MNQDAEDRNPQPTTLAPRDGNSSLDPAADSPLPADAHAAVSSSRRSSQHPLAERAVFVVLLLLLAIPVYAPALNRFFAADQLWYFAELKNDLSLSNGLRLLDYNAVRTYWKGDQALYRPLLFGWQAVGSSWFGYRYRAWNIANLVFHLFVVYLLYELLRRIQPTIFAGAFALVFSVLTKDCEIVMWNHLGGYLLGYAFLLLALLAVQRLPREHGRRFSVWLAVYVFSLSAAMLFHELAVICAVLLSGYLAFLWKEGRIRTAKPLVTAAAMLVPLLVFAALYVGHLTRVEHLFWVDQTSVLGDRRAYPVRTLASLWLWTSGVFDPWHPLFSTPAFGRFSWIQLIDLPAGKVLPVPHDPTSDSPLRGLALVLVFGGGLLLCFRDGFAHRQWRTRAPFALLLVMAILAYSGMNNLGRQYTHNVTYYTYLFSLLSLVLLYSLVDFSRLRRTSTIVALVLLTGMGAANARQSYRLSRQVARENADVDRYAAVIEDFVNQHRNEPGFQFAVRAESKAHLDLIDQRLDPKIPMRIGFPSTGRPSDGFVRVSRVLYSKYYDEGLAAPDAAHHKYLVTPAP